MRSIRSLRQLVLAMLVLAVGHSLAYSPGYECVLSADCSATSKACYSSQPTYCTFCDGTGASETPHWLCKKVDSGNPCTFGFGYLACGRKYSGTCTANLCSGSDFVSNSCSIQKCKADPV